MPARKKPAESKGGRRPIRREIGALVCFLLAVFTLFSLFGVKAWLIGLVGTVCRFVLGTGFWVLPPAFVLATGVLLFHRGRPVITRSVCVFLIPFLMGVFLRLFYAPETDSPVTRAVSDVLRSALSVPVSVILLCIGITACILAIFRINPVAVIDGIRNRTRRVYEPEPEHISKESGHVPKESGHGTGSGKPSSHARRKGIADGDSPRRRPDFDVPIYAGPDSEPEEPAPVGVLPKRNNRVKTPADAAAETDKNSETPPWEEFIPVRDAAPLMVPVGNSPEPKAPELKPPEPAPPAPPETIASVTVAAGDGLQEEAEPYRYPPVTLLTATRPGGQSADTSEELKSNAERLISGLQNFGIGAAITHVTRGPSVTRYEIELESGVKLATLTSRADDIALALGAVGVNIAPVPNKVNVVGIEVPNKLVSTVYIRDIIDSMEFSAKKSPTSFVLGRDIGGQNIVADMAELTHLLIAGTTGSGKSVCMNTLITSMLYKASPEQLRFIMVDPKMVELAVYNGIPHLLSPVLTEPKRAAEALEWAVTEMDNRYNLLMQRGKRDINAYNEEVSKEPDGKTMPRIVIIIDEMADLMMVARKEVETAVARIAQKARACGVHLILATQRPEAKVVTGIIKANTPSRIAFAVKANLDSRIILDTGGAEKLVGRGDMLYLPIGAPKPTRVQGCFVSSEEIERVVDYIKGDASPDYSADMLAHLEKGPEKPSGGGGHSSPDEADSMLPAAIEVIIESGQGSTSYLQRRLKLGYARAARLMDEMEERGIVGPFEGSKPRQVLVTPEEWEEMKNK